jgi:heat-inducible transcriptional repressor
VDALLRVKQPLPEEREQIERGAQEAAAQFDGLMAAASRVLHALTKHAGVVAAPRPQSERLQRIEFLQLREGRVLALLVSRSGAVRNRLIALRPGETASAAELERSAHYLNELIADLTLAQAQLKLRAQLERDRRELDALQARALALGAQAVTPDEPAVHIEGQASLLEDSSLDVAKIRALFKALGEKERLLSVLDRTLEAQELQIFIGAESGIVEPDLAIVAAPYRLKGEVVGALGVIGPTRMDYARVVPLVELTARTVGMTLDAGEES